MPKRNKALDRAIRLAGGPTQIAATLGISKQAVSQWTLVPIKHLAFMAQFAPRKALRPDLYGAVK